MQKSGIERSESLRHEGRHAVLVVDSSAEARALAAAILGRARFEVDQAATVEEALSRLEQRSFRAILVEATNPHGHQSFLAQIAAYHPEVLEKTVALTSTFRTERFQSELEEMNLFGMIGRPYEVRELVEVVAACAARSYLAERLSEVNRGQTATTGLGPEEIRTLPLPLTDRRSTHPK